MELVFIGGCILFLLLATANNARIAVQPLPANIPPENRLPARLSIGCVASIGIMVALILLIGFSTAGIAEIYEQQGKCDKTIMYPNPPFPDINQCTYMVLPDR